METSPCGKLWWCENISYPCCKSLQCPCHFGVVISFLTLKTFLFFWLQKLFLFRCEINIHSQLSTLKPRWSWVNHCQACCSSFQGRTTLHSQTESVCGVLELLLWSLKFKWSQRLEFYYVYVLKRCWGARNFHHCCEGVALRSGSDYQRCTRTTSLWKRPKHFISWGCKIFILCMYLRWWRSTRTSCGGWFCQKLTCMIMFVLTFWSPSKIPGHITASVLKVSWDFWRFYVKRLLWPQTWRKGC